MSVFVNAAPVDAPEGATALDCVRVWSAEEAEGVAAGRRVITDSRGLPAEAGTPAYAGAIYRVVSARAGRDE